MGVRACSYYDYMATTIITAHISRCIYTWSRREIERDMQPYSICKCREKLMWLVQSYIPWVGGAFDWLLAILPPSPEIGRNNLPTGPSSCCCCRCWDAHHLPCLVLPASNTKPSPQATHTQLRTTHQMLNHSEVWATTVLDHLKTSCENWKLGFERQTKMKK